MTKHDTMVATNAQNEVNLTVKCSRENELQDESIRLNEMNK